MHNNAANQDGDFFVRQLMIHRKRIYAFIMALVGDSSDADDIMQDTAALMWEKYFQAEEITNFPAWGMRIAHYKILEFRRKNYRKKIQFDSELLDSISEKAASVNEKVDIRFEAMKQCLSNLDKKSRELIQSRHQKGQTVKNIARLYNIPLHNAYKQISRLHHQLVRCIRRALREEGEVL